MPHSAGGGSHSGGSHGGSSSHGGGGSFGGRSSRGGGGSFRHHGGYGGSKGGNDTPMPRISRHPGGRTYHYIYFNPVRSCYESYYYQGMSIPPVEIGELLQALAVKTVFVLFVLWIVLSQFGDTLNVFIPQKADLYYASDTDLTVDDEVGLISCVDDVLDEMEKFQDRTGVTSYLEVVRESDWNTEYPSLKKKALGDYENLFDDEMHCLFIISISDSSDSVSEQPDYKNTDYKWQLIMGDALYTVINSDSEDEFVRIMSSEFREYSADQIGQAFILGLQEYEKVVMKPQNVLPIAVICAVALAYLIWYFFTEISQYLWMKKCVNAKIAPHDSTEAHCPSCGLKYFTGTTDVCPKCGANLQH